MQYCMVKNIIHNIITLILKRLIKWIISGLVSFCNADLLCVTCFFFNLLHIHSILSNFEKIKFISYMQIIILHLMCVVQSYV